MNVRGARGVVSIFGVAIIVSILASAIPEPGSSRLVSVRQLVMPDSVGQACAWDDPSTSNRNAGFAEPAQPKNLFAALLPATGFSFLMAAQQRGQPLDAQNEITRTLDFRTLADTYPTYTSVGVNYQTDEVILQDRLQIDTRKCL